MEATPANFVAWEKVSFPCELDGVGLVATAFWAGSQASVSPCYAITIKMRRERWARLLRCP
jgi:hypothetical protein